MKGSDNTSAPTSFAVRIDAATRPGLKACGDYLVGRPYVVDAAEAARLVEHKGFAFVNASDAALCAAELERRAASAKNTAKAAPAAPAA